MSNPKIDDISGNDKLRIIDNWCKLFHISQTTTECVMTIMDVRGYDYPVENYPTWEEALDRAYVLAHAHTWGECCFIETEKEYRAKQH